MKPLQTGREALTAESKRVPRTRSRGRDDGDKAATSGPGSVSMSESSKRLAQIAANVQIGKIRRHIFLCAEETEPHCTPRDVTIIPWHYLTKRLVDLGLLADEHHWRLSHEGELPADL